MLKVSQTGDPPEATFLSYVSPIDNIQPSTGSAHGPPDNDYTRQDDFRRRFATTSTRSYPCSGERDHIANRIQRRRTQNRNSQRIYRQRRADELKKFEDRAIMAEETSERISGKMKELQSEVLDLRNQVEHLEAENLALRSSVSSMLSEYPILRDGVNYTPSC